MEALRQKLPLSVTLITFNEALNIERALKSLAFAKDVIVVDSFSTDGTDRLCHQYGVRFFQRTWPGYGPQKNFAQQQAMFDWVLNLDADEEVTEALEKELTQLFVSGTLEKKAFLGYKLARKTFYCGQWIRYGGWYPCYVMRFAHKAHASWSTPLVHEALEVKGNWGYLSSDLHHYSFHTITDQIDTNKRFAKLGAQMLFEQKQPFCFVKCLLKPVGKFLEVYIWKKGFLDGFYGFVIAINAAYSMFLKYIFLKEYYLSLQKDKKNALS